MKTKFTPGPWKHQATPGGWDGVYAGDQLLCNLALNVPENATLMAAAPEMFDALNKALESWEACKPINFDLLWEALKKARGES